MTDPIQDAIRAATDRVKARNTERDAYLRFQEEKIGRDEQHRNQFLRHCRIAEPVDYAKWLAGYLTAGGEITHPYDYRFDSMQLIDGTPARASWYVLTGRPANVPRLYGAQAVHVIVPAGSAFTVADMYGDIGHNSLYFTDGWTVHGRPPWVPLYSDVAELLSGNSLV